MKNLKQYNRNYYLITLAFALIFLVFLILVNIILRITWINTILPVLVMLFLIVIGCSLTYLLYFMYTLNMSHLIKEFRMIASFTEMHEKLYTLLKELSKKSQFRLDYPLIALLYYNELVALRKYDELEVYYTHTKNMERLKSVALPNLVLNLCSQCQNIDTLAQYFDNKAYRVIKKSNIYYSCVYFYLKKDYVNALKSLDKLKTPYPLSIQNKKCLLGKIYYRTNSIEELNKIVDEVKDYTDNPSVQSLLHLINTGEDYIENVPTHLITDIDTTIKHKSAKFYCTRIALVVILVLLCMLPSCNQKSTQYTDFNTTLRDTSRNTLVGTFNTMKDGNYVIGLYQSLSDSDKDDSDLAKALSNISRLSVASITLNDDSTEYKSINSKLIGAFFSGQYIDIFEYQENCFYITIVGGDISSVEYDSKPIIFSKDTLTQHVKHPLSVVSFIVKDKNFDRNLITVY